MRTLLTLGAAFSLHAGLLALPLLAVGAPEALLRPALLCWILAALALQGVEVAATGGHDDPPPPATLDGRLALLTGALLLLIHWAATLEFVLAGPAPAALPTCLGVLLLLQGIALRGAAMRSLGAAFVSDVMGRPGARLVQSGVYRWTRHPSELGLLAWALGGSLLLGSAAALLLTLLALAPLVLWRTRREERSLQARYGDEYREYTRAVGWLGPALRRA